MDAWAAYIESLNILGDPYTAGNTLAAQHDLISSAGKEYEDYLINWLNEHQNAERGLWTNKSPQEEDVFESANGLMKIVCIYDYFGATIPNADNSLRSAMEIIMTPGDYHVCCVYNPWVVIDMVIKSIKNSEGEERAKELRELVRASAPELIRETRTKISKYMVQGGGFHYHLDQPTHYSQKAYVACSPVPESDINATCVSSHGIINYMLSSLGVQRVPMWYAEDGEYVLNILANLSSVIKGEIPEPEADTFDDYDPDFGDELNGIVYTPGYSTTVHADPAVAGIHNTDGNSKYFAVNVVGAPGFEGGSDKVLKVNQYTYENGSDIAKSPVTVVFSMENHALVSDCYIIDTDMMVTEGSNTFMQLFYYNNAESRSDSFSLNFSGYTLAGKQYLKIHDNYAGLDNEKDTAIVDGIPFGEWFNLRVELYKIYTAADGEGLKNLEIIAKIYVDGRYVGKSEAARIEPTTGKIPDKSIGAVGFMTYRYTSSQIYFDNALAAKANKTYEAENVPLDPDVVLPETTGIRGTGSYFKTESLIGRRFNFRLSRSESEFYSVKEDPSGTKVWGPTTAGKITLTRQEDNSVYFFRKNDSDKEFYACFAGDNITEKIENQAFIFEQDIVFTGLPEKKTDQICRLEINAGPAFGYGFTITLSTDENGNVDFGGKRLHTAEGFIGIRQNEWTNLCFEVYGSTSKDTKIKVYINGSYALTMEPSTWYATDYSTKIRYWICDPVDASQGILLDNLFIGYVSKIYVDEQTGESNVPDTPVIPSEPPTDDEIELIKPEGTHEGGMYFHDAPYLGTKYNIDDGTLRSEFYGKQTSGGAQMTAKLQLTDEVNKAVHFYRTGADTATFMAGYRNSLVTASTEMENLVMVLETDIVFSDIEAGNKNAYMLELMSGSANGFQAKICISVDESGNVCFDEHETIHTAVGYEHMRANTWYNVRFEVYGDGIFKLYVNGKYAMTLKTLAFWNLKGYSRMEARFWVQDPLEDNHGLYLDNIYLGAESKEYIDEATGLPPAKPIIPSAEGTHTGGDYYLGENDGLRKDFASGASQNELHPSSGGKLTSGETGVTEEENKAMYIVRTSDKSTSFFAGYRNTDITATTVIENHVGIIEQDIAFYALEAGLADAYYLEIMTGSAEGVQARIYIGTNAEGKIEFSGHSILHTAEGYTPMDVGKWYNLRFELYNDGICKVFINGEYALTLFGRNVSANQKGFARMEVRYWIASPVDDGHGLIYDNIYLGADSKVYVNENTDTDNPEQGGGEPTDPEPGEGEEGGGTPTDPDPDEGEGGGGSPTIPETPSVDGTLSNGNNTDNGGWLSGII